MSFCAEQRLLFMLPVNLHQRRANLGEALHRCEFAVDRDPRAPTLGDYPPHDQLAPTSIAGPLCKFRHRSLALELEQSLDLSFLLAATNHVWRRTRAEQQT